jgi:hypothetical protein
VTWYTFSSAFDAISVIDDLFSILNCCLILVGL